MSGMDIFVADDPEEPPRRARSSRATQAHRQRTPERRDELLNVAVRIFYEKGYAETTLQDIADAMGFSKPAIYHYARNKEQLLVELYDLIVRSSIEGAQEIAAREDTGAERFMAIVERHLGTFLQHIQANAVFEVRAGSLSAPAKRRFQRLAREYTDILLGVYEEGVADGSLLPIAPGIAVNAVIGMLNSVHRWYRASGDVAREDLVAMLAGIVGSGVVRQQP